jgi:hypothetical protein
MVDLFALAVAHGLLAIAAIRLVMRDDLDSEGAPRRTFGLRRKRPADRDAAEDRAT